jgi:predicted DNA-binding antitoxin AbrB/MazE fold protein
MTKQVEAVYENGMLRPLEPLPLSEHQHVTVTISEAPERGAQRDEAYLASVKAEVAALPRIPTLEEIHKITAKDPTSWADAITAEREDRL